MITTDDNEMRTIVDIPPSQIHALAAICQFEHVSRAEAIRRAITCYVEQNESAEHHAAFGTWDNEREDSVTLQQKLRAEWAT